MADPEPVRPNGADPDPAQPVARKSLREIAEDAYDEVIEASEEDGSGEAAEAPAGQQQQPRDKLGRFSAKAGEPGEQQQGEEPAPSPEQEQQGQQPQQPAQPAQAASSEAPANWPAADRDMFAKQTPEAREFLLRRHRDMEGDYQRRVTANAAATQFVQSLQPVFSDQAIAQSLQMNQLGPAEAIREWASMHRRAISPDMRDRVVLWHEIGARMGLDPAAVYGQSQSGPTPQLTEAELKDPAIRYFADHVSRTINDVQALRGQIARMQTADANRQSAEAMKVTRWGIDTFAEEKGADGKLLRPDFDTVLPQIIELFNADPNRDLREAYEQARWMHPQIRAGLIAAERSTAQKQISNDRARQAVRTNTRGITSPVSKPPPDPGKPRSLRDTLEETADEIGFGS